MAVDGMHMKGVTPFKAHFPDQWQKSRDPSAGLFT
jgi:hypothetical protein